MPTLLNLKRLPPSVLVEILIKFNTECLTRFRSTCHFADEFAENHRQELSKRRSDFKLFEVRGHFLFHLSERRFNFIDPVMLRKEISAIGVYQIEISFERDWTSASAFKRLKKLFKSLQISPYCVVLNFWETNQKLKKVLKLAAAINTRTIGFRQTNTLSLNTVLTYPFEEKDFICRESGSIKKKFSIEKTFEGLKKLKKFYSAFPVDQRDFALEIFCEIQKKLENFSGEFPEIIFEIQSPIDIQKIFPKAQLIWRNVTSEEYNGEVFLLSFQSNLVFIELYEPFLRFRPEHKTQWMLCSMEKSKEALRKYLDYCINCEHITDTFFNHLCEKVDFGK